LKQAKETDTVLLFIAGHGFNDGPNYRFLATNAEWAGGALRGSTVVPWYALQEAVETAKGRRILLIDTCHAGNAFNQRLGNAAYHANTRNHGCCHFLSQPRHGLSDRSQPKTIAGIDAQVHELAVEVTEGDGA
jgi:hypothetical protein